MQSNRLVIATRWVLVVLVFGFIMWGPFYRQILGGESNIFRKWAMFMNYAVGGIWDVRYTQKTSAGEVALNRFEVLGFSSPREAPIPLRRFRRKEDIVICGKAMCRALGGQDRDIRLYARVATKQGWRWAAQGEWDICSEG